MKTAFKKNIALSGKKKNGISSGLMGHLGSYAEKKNIIFRHWSKSLRSHVRYARKPREFNCTRTFGEFTSVH